MVLDLLFKAYKTIAHKKTITKFTNLIVIYR